MSSEPITLLNQADLNDLPVSGRKDGDRIVEITTLSGTLTISADQLAGWKARHPGHHAIYKFGTWRASGSIEWDK